MKTKYYPKVLMIKSASDTENRIISMYFLVGSKWQHKERSDFLVEVIGLGVGGIIHFLWFDDRLVGSIQTTEFLEKFKFLG